MRWTSGWRTTSRLENSTMAMPSVCLQSVMRFEQAGMFMRRQINLRLVAGDDRLRAVAEPREKHQHLLRRGILRLVQNDEGVVQRPPAHIGQRRDFNRPALGVLLDFLGGQHVVQRVVQRAQIRRDFFVQIARQKSQRLAGLDRRARQNDPRNFAIAQSRERERDSQIGFARARRPDAERDVVLADGVEIFFLADGFGGDARLSFRASSRGRSPGFSASPRLRASRRSARG